MSNTFLPDSRWIGAGCEGTTKLAWKRDPSVPAGQPALGRFDCVCGNTINGVAYGGPDQTCGRCGRTWDGRGWLVQA